MARIQILELPTEHVGDDMTTPFILVIDQASEDIAKTLNPPGGDLSNYEAALQRLTGISLAEKIGARAVLVFEETIDIPANQPLLTPNTEQGIPPGSTYQMVIDGKPIVWEPAQPGREQESTGRPTHPDGTPYNYSEITAEGWEHCDGCRTWGQWTAEDPHDCPSTFVKGPAADG